MRKLFCIIVMVLFSGASIAQEKVNQVDEQGRKQGKWEKLDASGFKVYDGEFKDGYEIGVFTFYYPNGKQKAVLNYSDKGVIAKSKVFYEDGELLSQGDYKSRKKDGIWTYYTNGGKRISQESYKEGFKDGDWIIYDGDIIVEKVSWKNDKRDGVWHKKFETGYLYGNYKDNLLSGVYEEFYYNKKMKIKGTYDEGSKVGNWQVFDSEGNLIKTEKWQKDILVSSRIFLKTQDTSYFQLVDSIAYFYMSGKNSMVVTLKGEKINCSNPIDYLLENIELNFFMVVNLEKKFYVRYGCIEKIQEDSQSKKIIVTLNPKTDFVLYADEEAGKGLKSYFMNEEQEEGFIRR